jgi:hypothetical protein
VEAGVPSQLATSLLVATTGLVVAALTPRGRLAPPSLLSARCGCGSGAGKMLVLAAKQDSGTGVRSISPRHS